MATEKRLIDANALTRRFKVRGCFKKDLLGCMVAQIINTAPTVDAVPVKDIRLHHIHIDNEGVPEVKLQFGDRELVLRCDPVNVREVVHGHWEEYEVFKGAASLNGYPCSACGKRVSAKTNYCPDCGAKMDGDGNE